MSFFTPLDTAEIFDPETSMFIATAPMRVPHYLGTTTLLDNGDVLVVGGWRMQGNVIGGMTDAEVFTPRGRGSFAQVAPLHVARLNNTATLLPDGQVLVAGGIDAKSQVTASVEFYSPTRRHFVRDGIPEPSPTSATE